MNRKRSRGCGATARGSGLLGRAAQEMAAGGCMQHGRWVEAGKRVEARLQKADSGREGMACVSNRMGSEQAHGGVVGSRLRADACRGAGGDGARSSLGKQSRGWFADGMALVAASQAGWNAANGGREARFQQAKVSRGSRAGGRLQQVRCAARAKHPALQGAGLSSAQRSCGG